MDLINYYEVLGLEHPASRQEIKSSFRRKAKEIHPDVQAVAGRVTADDQMRLLLAAYQVLSNPLKKEEYDRSYTRHFRTTRFEYREFLRQRRDDFFSQARLVFHDLLNSNTEEAVILYEFLTTQRPTFRLEHFLDHEDFMDCAFLLAEALDSGGDLTSAYKLYRQIYVSEIEQPYFHHFIEEVVDRLRDLVCFKMAERYAPQFTISYIKDLMSFNFSRKDNAFFYKKIAEVCLSQGRKELAVSYLRKGLALDHKLAGVKKLKEKIGYTEATTR